MALGNSSANQTDYPESCYEEPTPKEIRRLCLGILFILGCPRYIYGLYFYYAFFVVFRVADYIAPEPYADSDFLSRGSNCGSGGCWEEHRYCTDADAQTIIEYYEDRSWVDPWSFEEMEYGDVTFWQGSKRDIVSQIFGGEHAEASVRIYSLAVAENARYASYWGDCDKNTVFTIYKSWISP